MTKIIFSLYIDWHQHLCVCEGLQPEDFNQQAGRANPLLCDRQRRQVLQPQHEPPALAVSHQAGEKWKLR